MLKMFRDRENGLCGGACRDSAQISRHLEKADTETLVDELMELTERAANGDVNLEQIDAYLDALDEKDPLPFKADSKAALSDFHNRHGLLIKESRAAHQRFEDYAESFENCRCYCRCVCDEFAGCRGMRDRFTGYDRAVDK